MGCLQVDSEFRNLTQVLALFLGYAGTSTDDGPDLVDAILKWLFVPAGSTDKAVRERACILIGELLASSSEAAISLWEDAIGALLQRATDSISAVRVAALDAVAAGCLSPPGTAVCSQLLVHASSAWLLPSWVGGQHLSSTRAVRSQIVVPACPGSTSTVW